MGKMIPLSLVVLTVALPLALSGRPSPRRSVRRLYWFIAIYIVLWCLLCLNVYPRYVFIE